jgi:hypothetical protein
MRSVSCMPFLTVGSDHSRKIGVHRHATAFAPAHRTLTTPGPEGWRDENETTVHTRPMSQFSHNYDTRDHSDRRSPALVLILTHSPTNPHV